jgi:hypothetical protein
MLLLVARLGLAVDDPVLAIIAALAQGEDYSPSCHSSASASRDRLATLNAASALVP